jgi:hypothetical protein
MKRACPRHGHPGVDEKCGPSVTRPGPAPIRWQGHGTGAGTSTVHSAGRPDWLRCINRALERCPARMTDRRRPRTSVLHQANLRHEAMRACLECGPSFSLVGSARAFTARPRCGRGSRRRALGNLRLVVLQITRHFTQRALSRACRAGGERCRCRKGADMPAPCFARLRHVVNNRDVSGHEIRSSSGM